MIYGHGYAFDAKAEFWKAGAKIRDGLDNSLGEWAKSALVREMSAEHVAKRMNALWQDRLCDPWFDGSSFDIGGSVK